MAKYRKKPIVIEAIQFINTPKRIQELSEFMDKDLVVSYKNPKEPKLKINTLEGIMEASINDYIIKGISKEFYPCKPDIFEKTYELIEGENHG